MIRGSFWPHPFVLVFSALWLTGIVYAAWVGVRERLWVLVVGATLLTFFFGSLVNLCISMSTPGEHEVISYLRAVAAAPPRTRRRAV